MKKQNFLYSGFSIMEVMIAAALLGVVSLGVMQVTKNMMKSSKTDAQRVEYAQVINQIQSLLRDEYSCEATLNGLDPSGGGSDVPVFKRAKQDGTTSDVLTAGQVYGTGGTPIFLKKMEIKNYSATSGIAQFVITMNKGRKDYNTMTAAEMETVKATAYGSPTFAQILRVQVILDATSGKIKDCISDKDDYTSGVCGMINGDWADRVKCKSIKVDGNGTDPSITAKTHMQVDSGLNVGSTLSGDPGNGVVKTSSNLVVGDKATIANDTTITSGKLIFNTGDARINQVAGNNLYIENKAGTAGANLIVGKSGAIRTTITSTSLVVNKNGAITGSNKLEVAGDALISGNSKLTIGSGSIDYDGTDLNLNKPTGQKVKYKDGSTNEEVASQGFVNRQLADALTGDSTVLSTLLSNLSTLIGANPTMAIAATTCGFYTDMTWNGTRCVDNRTTNCPDGKMVKGFTNGAIDCEQVFVPRAGCGDREFVTAYAADGTPQCGSFREVILCSACRSGQTCEKISTSQYICKFTVSERGDFCDNWCSPENGLRCSYTAGYQGCTGCCSPYWSATFCTNIRTGEQVLMEKWLSNVYDRGSLCSTNLQQFNVTIEGFMGPFNF